MTTMTKPFYHYSAPTDLLGGGADRDVVTSLGEDDDGTEYAYVGVRRGDDYADVLLTSDQVAELIDQLEGILAAIWSRPASAREPMTTAIDTPATKGTP